MGPSRKTLNKLYALSRNQCAFKNCDAPIIEGADTITGILCHIKARSPGGPRYDATQTDEQRHSDANLLLLCAKHAKIVDTEPERYTVAKLQEMKRLHEQPGPVEISQADAQKGELLFRHYGDVSVTAGGNVMVNSPGAVQASQVVFKNARKTVKVVPPAGSLASDLSRRNYVKHLIDRYQEFAKQQPGRLFRYAAVYSAIKGRFGADWGNIRLHQFESLVEFLQKKIDRTMLGSMNRGKGTPNYSTFAEYREKYEGGRVPKG